MKTKYRYRGGNRGRRAGVRAERLHGAGNRHRVPFGDLRIGPLARRRVIEALDSNWISEGRFVREFEEKFAAKFGWKHAIATSSGTDAGMVVWSAVRELNGYNYACHRGVRSEVITPACAFVATGNCLLAAGIMPAFLDIELGTLNLDPGLILEEIREDKFERGEDIIGIQFVATMGKPTPVKEIAKITEECGLWLVYDGCEAHGAALYFDESPAGAPANTFTKTIYADHLCDAAIYSFYAAHLIVSGEGGMICTDDNELAELCRSIK